MGIEEDAAGGFRVATSGASAVLDTVVVMEAATSRKVKGVLFFKSRAAIGVEKLLAALSAKNVEDSIGRTA